MNPLSLIPLPYRLASAALVFAIVAGAAALQVHRYGNTREDQGYSRGHAEFTALKADYTRRALIAEEAAQAEDARRAAAQKEIEDAHAQELQRARADAAIADAAAGRLRDRVAALIAAARGGGPGGDPAPVGVSPAASSTDDVLADVLGRCVGTVRQLAEYADQARSAGTSCQLEYDALTPAVK